MSGAGPIEGIVAIAELADLEHGGDCRGLSGGRGPGVIDDALEFLCIGETPIGTSREFGAGSIGQSLLPIHPFGTVGLLPHEAGGLIGNGPIPVIVEVIFAVSGVASDIPGVELRYPPAGDCLGVAFDPAIGEIDSKDRWVAAHGRAQILGGRPILAVDDANSLGDIPVGEFEVIGVEIGTGVGHLEAAGSVEINEGINFLDGRHAPVGVAASPAGSGTCDSIGPRHLLTASFHPHQASVEIGDRAVVIVPVTGLRAGVLGILAVEGLMWEWRRDLMGVIKTAYLAGADDLIEWRGGGGDGEER